MKNHWLIKHQILVLVLVLCFTSVFAGSTITLVPNKPKAVYQTGEDIVWQVQVRGDQASSFANATYVLKEGGGTIIGQGTIAFQSAEAAIHTSLTRPGTILAEVTATNASHQTIRALAGAAIAPDRIPVSSPCPEDFDAFWKSKLAELATVPEHPVLQPDSGGKPNAAYWKITLDNIRGTHIHGQLARPAQGEKFPAMLVVQWAGVYPLQQKWATDHAAEGWLVLNILAHDLPIDEPKSFYDELNEHALKNYTAIGNDDRERSYFLRMFLACYRAVDYLSERPDWDGKTLVVTGTSQGGLQSFVAAGLNHKVTAVLDLVPAGCDNTGGLVGRKPGWPYWMAKAAGNDEKKLMDTSRYFDGVNFAARITCPTLVGLGLIDTTAAPSGVFAAINQIHAPKEVVVMPDANHHGSNKTHAPFEAQSAAWRKALLNGTPVPPK